MLLVAVEVLTRVTIICVFLQISLCDIQSRPWHNLAERVRASTKKHCKHVTHLAESMGPLLHIPEDVTLLLLFKLHNPIRLATMAASVVGRHGGFNALQPALLCIPPLSNFDSPQSLTTMKRLSITRSSTEAGEAFSLCWGGKHGLDGNVSNVHLLEMH